MKIDINILIYFQDQIRTLVIFFLFILNSKLGRHVHFSCHLTKLYISNKLLYIDILIGNIAVLEWRYMICIYFNNTIYILTGQKVHTLHFLCSLKPCFSSLLVSLNIHFLCVCFIKKSFACSFHKIKYL